MIFRSAEERGSHRQKLAGQQRKSICDNCLHGHKQECDYDDCCCICNEVRLVKSESQDPMFRRLRQSDRIARNRRICELRAEGQKVIVIATRFHLSLTTVQHILHGRHNR